MFACMNKNMWISVQWTPSSLRKVREWAARSDAAQPTRNDAPRTSRPAQEHALEGGAGANSLTSFKPNVAREFYRVNEHGARIGRTRYTAEAGVTPMDVVKRITVKVMKPTRSRSRSPSRQSTRVPASVRAAVANAVRQNFMCTCNTKRCGSAACHERGVRKSMGYLDQYANDSKKTFTRPMRIYLKEKDREQVREYEASYRLLNNPTRANVRDGVNKDIVVRFVRAFRAA